MKFTVDCCLYNVEAAVSDVFHVIFGTEREVRILETPADVRDFLTSIKFPAGEILMTSMDSLNKEETLSQALSNALKVTTFHLVIWNTSLAPSLTTLPVDAPNIHIIAAGEQNAVSTLQHHCHGIKTALELIWLRQTVSDIAHKYEEIYASPGESHDNIERFVRDAAKLIDATSLHIYSLNPGSNLFQIDFGSGPPFFETLDRHMLDEQFGFTDTSLVYTSSSSQVSRLVRSQPSSLVPTTELAVVTYTLQGLPGVIIYGFDHALDDGLAWEICSFLTRELVHLIRSLEMAGQLTALKFLTEISNVESNKPEMIWQVLTRLKRFFKADGVSVLECLDSDGRTFRFEKTYVHKGRHESETFNTDFGLAIHCITTTRALLMGKCTWTDKGPDFSGLAFDENEIAIDHGQPITVRAVVTEKTIENEESVMYYPLKQNDAVIGVLKVSDFHRSNAFTLAQLIALRTFAEPVASMLGTVRAIEGLNARLQDRATEEKIFHDAEVFFFYRDVALGIFHQVGNYLNSASSDMLVLQSLTTRDDRLHAHINQAKSYIKSAKDLIVKAHFRGQTLAPVGKSCQLLKDVVRPVMEYAKNKATGTGIIVEHSLTNRDFPVFVDPELAIESMINLIDNAFWAIRANAMTSKKELFVVVREVEQAQAVKIEITDSGIGVSPDDFPKLFTPYFTRRPKGTGLGLYFTKRLVEQFGGTVSFPRSYYPGRGTTVLVTFPLKER